MEVVKGQWEIGVNAGGSRNDLDNFATNPQYAFTLHEAGKVIFGIDNINNKHHFDLTALIPVSVA